MLVKKDNERKALEAAAQKGASQGASARDGSDLTFAQIRKNPYDFRDKKSEEEEAKEGADAVVPQAPALAMFLQLLITIKVVPEVVRQMVTGSHLADITCRTGVRRGKLWHLTFQKYLLHYY